MNQKKPCICGRAYWPAQAWDHEKCVANAAVEAVANEVNKRKPGRYRDPEKRRVYMRELMRSKRAKTKSEAV